MTNLPASPFLDAADEVMISAEQAAAPSPLPTGGAAADFLAGSIHDPRELFAYARMLCAQARIHPGTISPEAVAVAEEIRAHEEAYYDPAPLFLQGRAVA